MIGTTKGKKVQLAVYISPQQASQLKRLCEGTRIPLQVYLGEAIDDLLSKYAASLRKAGK